MPCPTCDHTMQQINTRGSACQWFWCPRCGTIREDDADSQKYDDVPKLVEQCRKFRQSLKFDYAKEIVGAEWVFLGISESINKPEDRP